MAEDGVTKGSSEISIPCDCKKPHFSLSDIALHASSLRLSNSAQLVAISANLTLSLASKDHLLLRELDKRIPLGSESKFVCENSIEANLAATSPIPLPDNRRRPPSTDFIFSCERLGLAVSSNIEGELFDLLSWE
ncbi:MAG: Uncharacterised protein [Methanobacteriota archaeon]|nr:MAG: Uncharacterised protein [Euryarchaeota archaeon]